MSAPAPLPPSEDTSRAAAPRDETLDVLRGSFIVLMVSSHFAPHAPLTGLLHLEGWVTPASGFVALSGLVLGQVSRRRLERGGLRGVHGTALRRVVELWAVHVALMMGLLGLHELTGHFDAPPVSEVGGWLPALWQVATLRLQSTDWMNILPLYVVLLGVAPLAVELCRRLGPLPVLLPSLALYVAAQRHPELLRLGRLDAGPEVFSLAAWQFVFFLGWLGGWYRGALGPLWARHRRWALPLGVALYGVLFLLAQLHRPRFAAWHLLTPEQVATWFGRQAHAPGLLAYFLGRMVVLGVLVEAWRRTPWGAWARGALVLLGRNSLSTFVLHLPLAMGLVLLGAQHWPGWVQDGATVAGSLLVYLAVRLWEGTSRPPLALSPR